MNYPTKNYYKGSSFEEEHLEHFGVKGMKWGVRRYVDEQGQMTDLGRKRYGINGTRGSIGMGRDLNKMDKEISRAQAKSNRLMTKYEGMRGRKVYRAQKRGEADPEETDREKRIREKAENYKALADRGRKFTEKIISDSVKKGRSVYSKDFNRSVNIGRNALTSFLATTAAKISGGEFFATHESVVGKKYKVRDNGKGVRAHKSKRRHDKNVQTKTRVLVT